MSFNLAKPDPVFIEPKKGILETFIFKPLHDFLIWASGDPTSPTFSTRKTFIESLLGIFGFFIIRAVITNVTGEQIEAT